MKNIVQVIPINDIQKHTEEYSEFMGIPVSKCLCQPKTNLDINSGGWIMVHSSWDGREALEEVNEILNNK